MRWKEFFSPSLSLVNMMMMYYNMKEQCRTTLKSCESIVIIIRRSLLCLRSVFYWLATDTHLPTFFFVLAARSTDIQIKNATWVILDYYFQLCECESNIHIGCRSKNYDVFAYDKRTIKWFFSHTHSLSFPVNCKQIFYCRFFLFFSSKCSVFPLKFRSLRRVRWQNKAKQNEKNENHGVPIGCNLCLSLSRNHVELG